MDENKRQPLNQPLSYLPHEQLMRPLIQTLGTGLVIASACYPIELLQTRRQVSQTPQQRLFTVSSSLLSNWRPLLAGYCHANKSSLMKNSVISTREPVHSRVNEVLGDKESMSDVEVHNHAESSQKATMQQKLKATVVTSMLIGSLDTLFTNYFSNMRIQNALGHNPVFSMAQKLRFARVGAIPRFGKNGTNALFCIGASTILKDPLEQILPHEHYGASAQAAATIVSGCCGGLLANTLDVIYKNTVNQTNLITLKAPDMLTVSRKLLAEGGARAFLRGSPHSMLTTVIAYAGIEAVDHYVNHVLYPKAPQEENAPRMKP